MSGRLALAAVLCAALSAPGAVPASAQTAYLVKDIAPGEAYPAGSISPIALFPAGDRLYFVADPEQQGIEIPPFPKLWVSDGTAAGTQALPDSCVISCLSGPFLFAALGRVAFFTETSLAGKFQLWRSDGTPAGTFLLADGLPFIQGSPIAFAAWKRRVYFVAYANEPGGGAPSEQLWRSDGTPAGTALVADLGPGNSQGINALTIAGGKLFLLAPGPAPLNAHATLWVSDGTARGTQPVSAAPPLDPRQLTVVADRLYFFASPSVGGVEQLWVSDGSAAGTLPLTRVTRPLPSGVTPRATAERVRRCR